MPEASWLQRIVDGVDRFFESIGHGIAVATNWVVNFLGLWPTWARDIFLVALLLAIVGVLASHILAIWHNCHTWKPRPNSQLTFSYACGTGSYQRTLMYKEAHKLLRDWKWSWASAAGVAYRLGNLTHASMLFMALGSIIYLPLMIVGLVEMILRVIIGTVWLLCASLAQRVVLIALDWLSRLAILLGKMADKSARVKQYCCQCYQQFDLPNFVCPGCGETITHLVPARTGVFLARCQCGCFLPTMVLDGRSRLNTVCPSCEAELVGANAKQFSIIVIGGNTSGKTAFVSAFQHQYLQRPPTDPKMSVYGAPPELFAELESDYASGVTEPSDTTGAQVFHFAHEVARVVKDTLVICDIPDEVIYSGAYEKNPLHLAYTDGIVIIVDPLSVASVRQECSSLGDTLPADSYSTDDANDLIVRFIQQFSDVVGRSARRMINVPMAVVVNKTDIKAVKRNIGATKIAATCHANPDLYHQDLAVASNELCQNYLSELGFDNALHVIESVFSDVRFFPVSAMGHPSHAGASFSPTGVIEPIAWLAQQSRARIATSLADAQKEMTK